VVLVEWIGVEGFDAGLESCTMVFAVTFADTFQFLGFETVLVAVAYGLCFEFVVVDFLDLEYFSPVPFFSHHHIPPSTLSILSVL